MIRMLVLLVLTFGWLTGNAAAQKSNTTSGQSDESNSTNPNANSIMGRVLTVSGQPVTNATVLVSRLNSPSPPRPVPTDSTGSFRIAGLEPGVFSVTAYAASFVLPPADVETSQPTYYRVGDSVTVTMTKGGVINGTVTDTDGQPVVAIRVRALMVRDEKGQPANGSIAIERVTDDRGVYRLFGLTPGAYVVSAGGGGGGGGGFGGGPFGGGRGGGGFGFAGSATALYDRDAPTFSPSSTRDTAAEIAVYASEEVNNVDIKFRKEPGHTVSGTVKGPPAPAGYARTAVTLTRAKSRDEVVASYPARGSAFEFRGVADGEYEISAQTSLGPNDAAVSLPRKIIVNGANITGIALMTSPLATISGHVALEKSVAPECQNKRQPRFEELLISARRNVKKDSEPQARGFAAASGTPGKSGDFFLNKLGAGAYRLDTRFFAKYWYLRAVTGPAATAARSGAKSANVSQPVDIARNGLTLQFGRSVSGLVIALAEGAASVRGHITVPEDKKAPLGLSLYIVPAEKDKSEDVLRFFTTAIADDGTFGLNNLPPGHYWAIVRFPSAEESHLDWKLRLPDQAQNRVNLRRAAEAAKIDIELKPCQNLTDYQLPLNLSASK
ncbi:MAG TPA: carboxypeptidase-like regulatory domain-containing protein [Pyrinomonadaceae bacterium]|nr:carboxypeptidase-like regulatory domain-containing protein [Pyrinomonadaceae bacterium]